ncbi:MAG: hypothetical protein HW421_2923 [Ignavibacteria bacterium]|nr:hypothetical protein [Ignavibacteria bacterium]
MLLKYTILTIIILLSFARLTAQDLFLEPRLPDTFNENSNYITDNEFINYKFEKNKSPQLLADTLPFDIPKINCESRNNPWNGQLFITNFGGKSSYVLLYNDSCQCIAYKQVPTMAMDFKMQPNGLFSYCLLEPGFKNAAYGWAFGDHLVMDTNLNVIDTFRCGNGYIADFHEFKMLPNGHSFVMSYYSSIVDMTPIGGNPTATVVYSLIQELDAGKNVVFQWRAEDYIPFEDSFSDLRAIGISPTHINSVELDTDGNIIISSRQTSELTKVNRQTGDIIWRLGGKRNQFQFIGEHPQNGPTYFSFQHDARRMLNGNLTLYDNGNQHKTQESRSVEYKLDEINKKCELVWEYNHTPYIFGPNMGSSQRLPNGNSLICWGGIQMGMKNVTEVKPYKTVAIDITFQTTTANAILAYRAYKFDMKSRLPNAVITRSKLQENDSYSFEDLPKKTGVKIKINNITPVGAGIITVEKYPFAPYYPTFGGRAPIVTPDHIIIKPQNITSVSAEIRFDLGTIDWAVPMSANTVYLRETPDNGSFTKLPTTFDNATNELVVTTTKFGEFIFGKDDIVALPPAPILSLPTNGTSVNSNNPATLVWAPKGYTTGFHLQVAVDTSMNNFIINDSTLKSAIYAVNPLETGKKYFWRVRSENEAGWGNWSQIFSFNSELPFIKVTRPALGEIFYGDSTKNVVRWQHNVEDPFRITLYKNGLFFKKLSDSVPIGSVAWWHLIDLDTPSDTNYTIKITSYNDSTIFAFSEKFTIDALLSVEDNPTFGNAGLSDIEINPNPINSTGKISFKTQNYGWVCVKLVNIDGTEIQTLYNGRLEPGYHSIDIDPQRLADGFYILRLQTIGEVFSKKIIILK